MNKNKRNKVLHAVSCPNERLNRKVASCVLWVVKIKLLWIVLPIMQAGYLGCYRMYSLSRSTINPRVELFKAQ